MNKTQKRAAWLKKNKKIINNIIKQGNFTTHAKNAYYCVGWTCGHGWWLNALRSAGIKCPAKNYWSGSAPTPSTAIPTTVANYINTNCPIDLK